MKKSILWILLLVMLCSIGYAYDDSISSGEGTTEATCAGNSGGTYVQAGESIVFNETYLLDSYEVYIKSTLTGTPSGLLVEVYLNDSGNGNWSGGTFVTSANISDGDISDSAYNKVTFKNETMTAGVEYIFVVRTNLENEAENVRYSCLRSTTDTFGDGIWAEGANELWTPLTDRDWRVIWNVWSADTAAVDSSDLYPYLEAYYKFGVSGSDGGTIIDYSPQQRYNISTYSAGSGITNQTGSNCKVGDCISCGGTGNAYGTFFQYAAGSNLTICWWMNSTTAVRSAPWGLSKDNANTNHITPDLGGWGGDDVWAGYFMEDASNRRTQQGSVDTWAQSEWHFYCYTFEDTGDYLTIYYDGVNDTQTTTSTDGDCDITGIDRIYLCDHEAHFNDYFTGYIDDWYYFNKILTTDEMAYLMTGVDLNVPIITGISADTTDNKTFNLITNITFVGTADTVIAEVQQPDGTETNYTMTNISSTWNYTYLASQTGVHNLTIYANDTDGNIVIDSILFDNTNPYINVTGLSIDTADNRTFNFTANVSSISSADAFAYWSFDTDDNLTDSASGYAATLTAVATHDLANYALGDGSYNLSGNGQIRLGSIINFTNNDFSISFWWYPQGSAAEEFHLWDWNNPLSMYLNHQADDDALWLIRNSSGTELTTEMNGIIPYEWYYITLVRNSTHIAAFVDGTLNSTPTVVPNTFALSSTSGFDIGRPSANKYGSFDEFSIWEKALSTAEMTTLMTQNPYSILLDTVFAEIEQPDGTKTNYSMSPNVVNVPLYPTHEWLLESDLSASYGGVDLAGGTGTFGTVLGEAAYNWSGSDFPSASTLTGMEDVRTVIYWTYLPNAQDKKVLSISDGNSADDCLQMSWHDTFVHFTRMEVDNVLKWEFLPANEPANVGKAGWAMVTHRIGGAGYNLTLNDTAINTAGEGGTADTMQSDWDSIDLSTCAGSENMPAGNYIKKIRLYNEYLTDEQIVQLYESDIVYSGNYTYYNYSNYPATQTGTHTVKIIANDNAGNINDVVWDTFYGEGDTTAPVIGLISPTNYTWHTTRDILFIGMANDTQNLIQNCSLWTNETSWSLKNFNDTCINATNCNIGESFSGDGDFLWGFECYDDKNNGEFSENYTIRIDSIYPSWSNNRTNSTLIFYGDSVQFNLTVSDINPGNYTFQYGNGTDLINDTPTSYTDGIEISVVKTITAIYGMILNVTWYLNDLAGNLNITDTWLYTLGNTAPIVTINSPTDGDNNNVNLTVNFDYSDSDNSDGDCYLYVNGGINASSLAIASGSMGETITSVEFTNDGNYSWYINCTDGTDYTTTGIRYYILDTTNPIRTPVNPITTPYYTNNNITYQSNWSDANLYKVNVSQYNLSNDLLDSILYDEINNTIQEISKGFNFTTDGNYTIEDCGTDDHTYGELDGLNYTINYNNINFTKGENNVGKAIYVSYMGGAGGDKIKIANQAEITAYNFTISVEEKDNIYGQLTEFKWNLSFIKPVQDKWFGFSFQKGVTKLRDETTGHFTWHDYYIDFNDMVNSGFPVRVMDNGTYWFVYTNTSYCDVEAGEICVLDPALGGLNEVCENTTIIYDTTNPTITGITLTPSLDIEVFDDYYISLNSTDLNNITLVNASYKTYNGDGVDCYSYYINGTCMDYTPRSINLSLETGNIYNSSYIRPDDIYPQISFGDDKTIFWDTQREGMSIWNEQYHVIEFINNFTVNASIDDRFNISNKFYIVLYSTETKESKAWNLSYRNGDICNSTSWFVGNKSDWSLQNTSGCPDVHIHLARNGSQTYYWVEFDTIPLSKSKDLRIYLFDNTTQKSDFNNNWLNDNNLIANFKKTDTTHHTHSGNSSHYLIELTANENRTADGLNVTVCSNDIAGNIYCDNEDYLFSGIGNLAPIANAITNPIDSVNISGILNITWAHFIDPNGDDVFYNISLRNPDKTLNYTVGYTNSSLDTNITFDTTSVIDGVYNIMVIGCDGLNLCSNSTLSENFSIDNTNPIITISSPSNNSVYTLTSTTGAQYEVTTSFSAIDNFTGLVNCSLENSLNGVIALYQLNNINLTGQSVIVNYTHGTHYWWVRCEDYSGNIDIKNYTLTINPGETGGAGGGGVRTVYDYNLNEGRDCNFKITPESVRLDSIGDEIEIKLQNLETRAMDFSFKILDKEGKNVSEYILFTNDKDRLHVYEYMSMKLSLKNDIPDESFSGEAELVIMSDGCEYEKIPIKTTVLKIKESKLSLNSAGGIIDIVSNALKSEKIQDYGAGIILVIAIIVLLVGLLV